MLDEICVLKTSINKDEINPKAYVRTYKNLSRVERAFRTITSVDIKIRPIHH